MAHSSLGLSRQAIRRWIFIIAIITSVALADDQAPEEQPPEDHAPDQEPEDDEPEDQPQRDENPYTVFGLGPEATLLDVQLAYMNITLSYDPKQAHTTQERHAFLTVQKAFEDASASNLEMREETLVAVNYWDHLTYLEDDEDLQYFAELQAGGSAQLRVIFVVNDHSARVWSMFSLAAQMSGRVKVGVVNLAEVQNGQFFTSLKVRQFPAAILFDPVSRASRIGYGLEGVFREAERLLSGQQSPHDRIARVQELSTENFDTRCQGGLECEWTVLLATNAAIEDNQETFTQLARPFIEACKTLHYVKEKMSTTAACFWLRLGRADPTWRNLLAAAGGQDDLSIAILSSSPKRLKVAPATHKSPEDVYNWFRDTITAGAQEMPAPDQVLPALPAPHSPAEDPPEGTVRSLSRKFNKLTTKAMSIMDDKFAQAQKNVMAMDAENKTMLAGAVLLALMLVGFVCKSCCLGRRAASEEEAIKALSPVVAVELARTPGAKLGISINQSVNGFLITGFAEEGLVPSWNNAEPVEGRRIHKGDEIVYVITIENGKESTHTTHEAMSAAIKSTHDLVLGVKVDLKRAECQRVIATVLLDNLVLKDIAEYRKPQYSCGGSSLDKESLEIAKLGPALESWNAARQAEGACCMQIFQEGDRIVSVNGETKVNSKQKGVATPQLVVARFRPPICPLRSDTFEVSIHRTSDQDRLGMRIQKIADGSEDIEVLAIVAGGIVDRWNNTPGSRKVLKGDRILAVDGARDRKSKEAALGSAKLIQFGRWIDDGPGNNSAPASVAAPGLSGAPLAAGVSAPMPPPVKPAAPMPKTSTAPAKASGASSGLDFVQIGIILLLLGGFVAVFANSSPSTRPDDQVLRLPKASRSFMRAIHPELYAEISTLLLFLGGVLALHFLWYEVSMLKRPSERQLLPQLIRALLASIFLGFGNLFLLTWAGVYV